MTARKEGSFEEMRCIRSLLSRDNFKTQGKYRGTWAAMCTAAAKDAIYYCTLITKVLRKIKIPAMTVLDITDICYPQFYLSIPSLAYVMTKMYKTFEVKLGTCARRALNQSHAFHSVADVE